MTIPKIIHQLWIGDKPRPDIFMETWREKHINMGYEYILWNEEEIKKRNFKSSLQDKIDQIEEINGKDAYRFKCPFCSQYSRQERSKRSKRGRLVRTGDNTWIYTCSRGFSNECRGGARSFHNFLAMLHPGLFREYQRSLSQG